MTLESVFSPGNVVVFLIFALIIIIAVAFANDENKRRW